MIRYLDFIIYWTIILIPFSMAIAPAPMNIFMGFLIASFLIKKILKKERIFTKTAINIPLLFLFVITCLSIFNSVNCKDTFKGGMFRLLEYIFIFFIMVEELKDRKHIRKIILSMFLGIILVSFDEIWQILIGKDFIRGYAPIINLDLVRATASFKDANTLGIYLSAIAPLILGLALYYFKGRKKIAMFLLSLLALGSIVLTYSRPTLLAIYIALFFFGFTRKHLPLIIFLIILTFISPFIIPRSVKDWAKAVSYNPLRFMCNDDRIAAYRNSINMIKNHPVIGVGANTFMKNYKKYKESPEYRDIVTSDYMYAHNNFLHMAAEIGLLGLGIFIWLLYKLFRQCLNIYKKLDDRYLKIISLSLSVCLVAFLVNGLTESSLYASRVAMIFWYLMGFSLALNKFTPPLSMIEKNYKLRKGGVQIDNKAIRNILVVRNDRFGEFLLNIPALRALKETFTNAKIIIVINPYVRDLAESLSFIDEIIEWAPGGHSFIEKLRLIRLLKDKNINIAVMLNPSKEFNIISYLSGIPVRVGYARKWGFLLTHKMQDRKYLGQKHEVEYNLELVGSIGAKTQDKTLSLKIDDATIKDLIKDFNIQEQNNNLVVIHPWTSDPIKQWPLRNFAELAKRLIKELGVKVVVVGGKEELNKGLEVFKNFSQDLINLTGKTTLRQLAALLKRCKLLISGDSGPVHLACAVGTPVIAIFRSDICGKTAKRWGPWGEGHIVIEKDDLDDINIDEVFKETKEKLDK